MAEERSPKPLMVVRLHLALHTGESAFERVWRLCAGGGAQSMAKGCRRETESRRFSKKKFEPTVLPIIPNSWLLSLARALFCACKALSIKFLIGSSQLEPFFSISPIFS